jgi:hypothetical protein
MKSMLTLLLFVALPQPDTVRVAERVCSGCSVSMDHVATLGDDDGPGSITFGNLLALDARGRYWLVHRGEPARIAVYSAAGRFIRTVGRSGGAPGEYRRIWLLTVHTSGMLVSDDFAKRTTLLDLDFNVVDTRPSPETPQSMIVRRDGTGIMSAIVPTRDLIGITLHAFDASGRRLRSFAQTGLPYREDMRELFIRGLTPALDSSRYWVSHRMEYAFALCALRDDACRLFLRPAPWFPRPGFAEEPDVSRAPPTPRLRGVSQDAPQFVWTISWVPDARWRSALERATATEYRITDLNRYYDTILERIDVRLNRVIGSTRVDVALMEFIAPGTAWYYRENAEGIARLEVVRLRMLDKPRTREDP